MSKYYVGQDGAYFCGFAGVEPPESTIEAPPMPRQVWDDETWSAVPVDLATYSADKRWQIETGGITVAAPRSPRAINPRL